MNMISRCALIAVVLVIFLSVPAMAGAGDFDELFNQPIFEPGFYLAAGFDFRTDERPFVRTTPTMMADLLYYAGRVVAVKAGIGYNDITELDAHEQIRTRSFDLGVRFQDQRRLFSPYLETGYQYMRYSENRGEGALAETRSGLYFAIGMSAHVSRSYCLDITLKQVTNYFSYSRAAAEAPLPDDIGPSGELPVPCGYAPWIFDPSLYNPATLEIQARFRL